MLIMLLGEESAKGVELISPDDVSVATLELEYAVMEEDASTVPVLSDFVPERAIEETVLPATGVEARMDETVPKVDSTAPDVKVPVWDEEVDEANEEPKDAAGVDELKMEVRLG